MTDTPLIALDGVWVQYNETIILEDITFSVAPGDFVAILGPNGSGKTTLLKVMLGLTRPSRGTVSVFGKSPVEGRRLVGYMPQKMVFDVSFPINVFDVVLMGRYRGLFCRYTPEDREAAEEALRVVGMHGYMGRQIGRLSGGQQQRVFVARAIAKQPRLLLLDEPMASVDSEMQKSFYELLGELKHRMAIVMVTHDIGVVSEKVDKVACFNRRLFFHGPVAEGLERLGEVYECPIELLAHGVPHRVLGRHEDR
jgi:zinc transport system ATP-binding protein